MQGEDERDHSILVKYAYLRFVLPIWLHEMLDHNAPAAAAAAAAAATAVFGQPSTKTTGVSEAAP